MAFKRMTKEMENDSFEAFLLGETVYNGDKDEIKPTLCVHCRRFMGFSPVGKPYCEAFPDGIPDKVWDAKVDHTTPYTGDNGITFEP